MTMETFVRAFAVLTDIPKILAWTFKLGGFGFGRCSIRLSVHNHLISGREPDQTDLVELRSGKGG